MAIKKDKMKQSVSELDKLFSEASESSSGVFEEITKGNTKEAKKKPSEKPQKAQKKVFSFRAEVEAVDSWRVWADAKGLKVDELGEKAITEYIKRHSLTEDQRQIYELKMAQKKS